MAAALARLPWVELASIEKEKMLSEVGDCVGYWAAMGIGTVIPEQFARDGQTVLVSDKDSAGS